MTYLPAPPTCKRTANDDGVTALVGREGCSCSALRPRWVIFDQAQRGLPIGPPLSPNSGHSASAPFYEYTPESARTTRVLVGIPASSYRPGPLSAHAREKTLTDRGLASGALQRAKQPPWGAPVEPVRP